MEKMIRHNIHSNHVFTSSGDAVVVKEQVIDPNGKVIPKLVVYDNPKHDFYITKKRYQTYAFKTEFEYLERLDRYTVFNFMMKRKIADLMGIRGRYLSPNALFRSPYIFGADIDIQAILKMHYVTAAHGAICKPTYGFLDIETQISTNRVIMTSFLAEGHIYTAIQESWLYKNDKKRRVKIELPELIKVVKETLAKHTNIDKYKLHITTHPTEISAIIAIFRAIHKHKVDYIGAWNMDFDVSKIMAAIDERSKYSCSDIFCDPKLDSKYRSFKYQRDKGKTAHFTLKWHWVHSTAHSQFIDLMGLYSQCRRTQKFLPKYTLDAILEKHCNTHKMPIISDNHTFMQENHIMEYTAYNIFDVIGLDLLETANNDLLTMHMRCKHTPVAHFSRATAVSSNDLFYDLKQRNMILASKSSEDRFLQMEALLGKSKGGAVLNPTLYRGLGYPLT